MSVENSKVIDFINKDGNETVLSISDHLEWDDCDYHLRMLQDKINAYLMAIESGQVERQCPELVGNHFSICVYLNHRANEKGEQFFTYVQNLLNKEGYGFSYCLIKD